MSEAVKEKKIAEELLGEWPFEEALGFLYGFRDLCQKIELAGGSARIADMRASGFSNDGTIRGYRDTYEVDSVEEVTETKTDEAGKSVSVVKKVAVKQTAYKFRVVILSPEQVTAS